MYIYIINKTQTKAGGRKTHHYMKNKTIQKAIELGFDFDFITNDYSFEEIKKLIIDFLNEKIDVLEQEEDECEVNGHGSKQSVRYNDYWSSGEIVCCEDYKYKKPGDKIYHSTHLHIKQDGTPIKMNLYFLIGETDNQD